MNIGKTTALVLACAFAACGAASANPLSAAQMRQIDAIAAQALSAQHISGLEIGIGRSGKVLYTKGYGLRNRAANLPVTAQTIFPIGSITKQFTAAAVMELVDRGKVDLSARVSRYLPHAPHGGEVTVRELLNQTSGLPDYLEDKQLLASIMSGSVQ
ncbi:MAG TPA: serine hydrolase domain-containing protein, partial [Candidatus Baltobacteraceae bacterium]|nr:serine hydrolase domain-containing protein [Candidatus Baltobacteraceae bacterium]